MTLTEPDFDQLYRQHARAVHRYLARRVGSELADDLTGDTFVVAWRRRSTFDARLGSPVGWLYGIATNLAHRHRRRENAELRALAKLYSRPDEPSDPADRVADVVDAANDLGRLARALVELKPDDRDVLLLVAWAELTYEQVARALNIPIGTVRSRLHRVRRQLRSEHLELLRTTGEQS